MAETYLITAKTVEEAVSVAKREYEDSRHEVSYEIVEMPKKGFLGIGAKPAKIKVTVSKIMTVQSELGSLVADIKNLKNLTDRDGEAKKPQAAEKQEKQEKQEKPQGQNKPQQQKQGRDGQGKQNGGQQQKSQKQPQQQKQQNQQSQKQAQPAKQEQPEEQKPQKQGGQNNQKQNQNQNNNGAQASQGNQKQRQQNAPKKPAEPAKTAEPVKPAESATPVPAAVPEAPAAQTVQTVPAAQAAETTHRSALGNQAKPSRRNRARKSSQSSGETPVAATGVTVSAPVGLTDFVSDAPETGFSGSETAPSGSSGSRMNNDVRRKNRQQKETPKAAAQPAAEAVPAPAVQTAPAPAESGSGSSRRRSGRRPQNIQKAVNEDLASRYDIAESDEDYAKLDQLVAETEAAPAEKAEAAPAEPAAPVEDRRREAITREEMDYALEFANTLLKNMQLDARAVPAECPEGEDFIVTETADVYPKIDIIGSETGILIGHHGETLDSIQYLVNLSALRKTKSRDGDYVKIVVDIENYRQKREDTLRSLARRMAARAVRYRRNVFLEPMNAYERRIIHSELQSFENVSTHSVGADRDRKIIITYEGPEKAAEPRRKRRGEEEEEVRQEARPLPEKSRRRRGSSGAADTAAETAEPETAEKRERRPRKPTKMPIEQLTDWLPDAGLPEAGTEEAVSDEEDTLHVMSALRETAENIVEPAVDDVEETAEAFAEAVSDAEEAVEEAADAVDEADEADEAEETEEAEDEAAETEEADAAESVAEAIEDAADAAEEIAEAAEEAEEAITEAAEAVSDASLEEKAQALIDRLESFAETKEDGGDNA